MVISELYTYFLQNNIARSHRHLKLSMSKMKLIIPPTVPPGGNSAVISMTQADLGFVLDDPVSCNELACCAVLPSVHSEFCPPS
jgi:hypothetical protein